MSNDLTRAIRKLAELKRRLDVCAVAQCFQSDDPKTHRTQSEARRMARELEKQIKQQELSVRHWKLYGSGIGVYSIDGTSSVWPVPREYGTGCKPLYRTEGPGHYQRAVAYAERMNRKEAAAQALQRALNPVKQKAVRPSPCPTCGTPAKVVKLDDVTYRVGCPAGCRGTMEANTRRCAVEHWNEWQEKRKQERDERRK